MKDSKAMQDKDVVEIKEEIHIQTEEANVHRSRKAFLG